MKPTLLVPLVVVVHAGVQALLVLADPLPVGIGFVLVGVASAIALVLAVWVVALVLRPRPPSEAVLVPVTTTVRRRTAAPVLGRVVGLAVLAAAASLLSPLLVPVVLVLGAPFLVAGRAAFRRPLPAVGLVLLGLVLAAASWVGAIVADFFLGLPVAPLLIWLWFGAVAAFLLRGWSRVVV